MTDEIRATCRSVANTLRGMSFDPAIPGDAREVLRKQAERLDALEESFEPPDGYCENPDT